MSDYFPLDVALQEAFFDREEERKRLKNNILSNTHTLITSPRRYGKTSLVIKTFTELKIIAIPMDMMVASDATKVQHIILNAVGQASSQLAGGVTTILQSIEKIFQPFRMIQTIELGQFSLKFYPYTHQAPHLVVLDALQRLEKLAVSVKQKVVLFFDEYQHVIDIKGALDFEAALRSFAQMATHVMCIFSGSNRHLLQAMFSDQSRPFYNLCDHMFLQRISEKDYIQHLIMLSQKQWNTALPLGSVQMILTLTACHPYYVNALCRRLWQSNTVPDQSLIMSDWKQLASERHYEISSEFDKMTPVQRNIIIELSREPFAQPTSKENIRRLDASTAGIMHAIDNLLQRDQIYKDDQGQYHVLNPLMEFVLRQETLEW